MVVSDAALYQPFRWRKASWTSPHASSCCINSPTRDPGCHRGSISSESGPYLPSHRSPPRLAQFTSPTQHGAVADEPPCLFRDPVVSLGVVGEDEERRWMASTSMSSNRTMRGGGQRNERNNQLSSSTKYSATRCSNKGNFTGSEDELPDQIPFSVVSSFRYQFLHTCSRTRIMPLRLPIRLSYKHGQTINNSTLHTPHKK